MDVLHGGVRRDVRDDKVDGIVEASYRFSERSDGHRSGYGNGRSVPDGTKGTGRCE